MGLLKKAPLLTVALSFQFLLLKRVAQLAVLSARLMEGQLIIVMSHVLFQFQTIHRQWLLR